MRSLFALFGAGVVGVVAAIPVIVPLVEDLLASVPEAPEMPFAGLVAAAWRLGVAGPPCRASPDRGASAAHSIGSCAISASRWQKRRWAEQVATGLASTRCFRLVRSERQANRTMAIHSRTAANASRSSGVRSPTRT